MTSEPRAPASGGCSTTSARRCSTSSHGDPDPAGDIGGVVIHDPLDDPVLPRHALVLGVGVDDPDQVVALLRRARPRRAPRRWCCARRSPLTDEVRAAADAAGVALLGLSRGAAVGPPGRDAALGARRGRRRRGRAGVARRAAVRRPVRGGQRHRRRCWTRRSRSRTAARGCWPSPAGRTRPTPRASRRSSAGRCRSGTRGSCRTAATSASCTAATGRCSSSPPRRRRVHRCPASPSRSAPATRCSARSGPRSPDR